MRGSRGCKAGGSSLSSGRHCGEQQGGALPHVRAVNAVANPLEGLFFAHAVIDKGLDELLAVIDHHRGKAKALCDPDNSHIQACQVKKEKIVVGECLGKKASHAAANNQSIFVGALRAFSFEGHDQYSVRALPSYTEQGNHTGNIMLVQEIHFPWKAIPKVYHVGSLVAEHKGIGSMEGNGLSVSLCPNAWAQIAKLGNSCFTLERSGGRFLDVRAMPHACREHIAAWAHTHGWLESRELHEVSWLDSEDGQTRTILHDCAAKAATEAAYMREEGYESVALVSRICSVLTEAAHQRLGFKLDVVLSEDIAATFWVEDCTDADGVWWQDLFKPQAYSAPRGVISRKQLPHWQVHGPVQLT